MWWGRLLDAPVDLRGSLQRLLSVAVG
eukprot:COSAG02_NODE_67445_length_253_cov_0.623377_1_plen_26_part_10